MEVEERGDRRAEHVEVEERGDRRVEHVEVEDLWESTWK